MANLMDLEEQAAGGSTESVNMIEESTDPPSSLCSIGANTGRASFRRESSQGSGASSPGRSNSLSNSSRTPPTSDESLTRRSCSRDECSSPDQLVKSELEKNYKAVLSATNRCSHVRESVKREKNTVACQTDENSEYPPLQPITQQPKPTVAQQPVVAIAPPSTESPGSSTNCAEGTLMLVIQNFRNMTDTVRGPSKYIQGVPWRIMVMPRQHVVQKKGTQKCLGFFLQCCPEAYSDSWSCQAAAELRLMSQKPGVPNFTRKTNHVYTAKENDWGYSCFMTWADILDESQGFIKDDKVILEVSVKADPPKNILTHEQFQKKIETYKKLADYQCQRGEIDKAIDANASALKFCKDRDPACKTELEEQKRILIEMKLKQSIERIEKGSDTTVRLDEGISQAAVRQAMGGTATRQAPPKTQKPLGTKQKETTNDKITTETPPGLTKTTTDNENNPDNDDTIQQQQQEDVTLEDAIAKTQLANDPNGNLNKSLLALGNFNKELLNSETIDLLKSKCDDDDDLPAQLYEYIKTFSLDDKKSAQFRQLTADVVQQLSTYSNPTEEDVAMVLSKTNAAGECAFIDECMENEICETCMKEKLGIRKIESGCQTENISQVKSQEKTTETTTNTVNEVKSMQNSNSPPPAQRIKKKPVTKRMQAATKPNPPAAQPTMQTQLSNDSGSNLKKLEQNFQNAVEMIRAEKEKTKIDLGMGENLFSSNVSNTSSLLNASNTHTLHYDGPPMFSGMRCCAYYPAEVMASSAFTYTVMPMEYAMDVFQKFRCYNISESEDAKDKTWAEDTVPPNIFSRQFIEEWLRYNTKNVWKFYRDGSGKPLMMPPPSGVNNGLEGTMLTETPNEAQTNQVMAALSVIGINCVNARRIMQKFGEFIEALENHANFRDLRANADRLMALTNGDPMCFPRVDNGDAVSIVTLSDSGRGILDIQEQDKEFSMLSRMFMDEDVHDFMLVREAKRIEIELATRLQHIIYQLHPISISQIVDRVESRIRELETELLVTKRTFEQELESYKVKEGAFAKEKVQAQAQIQAANEKAERFNQQLKEKKNEIKKLEKKAKLEAQLAAENTELHEKVDQLTKELGQLQRQLNEEQLKYKRDTQSLADSKKHLNVELNQRYSEVQKLTNQLEEKTQALKKSESQLANERKGNASTITSLTERVKKAEVGLLEHKLEDGLKLLERARDDCQAQIRILEDQLKAGHFAAPVEQEVIKKNVAEWKNKSEEVLGLITTAKNEFNAHISSIKAGKHLSQLPKIQVAKPPPPPKLHKMPVVQAPVPSTTTSMTQPTPTVPASPLPLERKVITPPNANKNQISGRFGATTPQQSMPPTQIGAAIMSPSNSSTYTSSRPNSTNVTPVKTSNVPPIAPIGVRPANYQNGVAHPKPTAAAANLFNSMPPSAQQQNQQQANTFQQQFLVHQQTQQQPGQPSQTFTQPPPQTPSFSQPPPQPSFMSQTSQPSQQQQSSYSPWPWGYESLNNIADILGGPTRSFGPLGSDFGGPARAAQNASPVSMNNNNPAVSSPIAPPQQRNGWTLASETWNPSVSGRPL
uniref:MATH domain-containing protein n=1 Tax=Acrobeloides nanus TaxID=290746 RepID=A0A914C2I6_9BILA